MRPDKAAAKAAGVPKWLRRYSKQYGKGIWHLLQEHKKSGARERPMGIPALPERVVIEGLGHVS